MKCLDTRYSLRSAAIGAVRTVLKPKLKGKNHPKFLVCSICSPEVLNEYVNFEVSGHKKRFYWFNPDACPSKDQFFSWIYACMLVSHDRPWLFLHAYVHMM